MIYLLIASNLLIVGVMIAGLVAINHRINAEKEQIRRLAQAYFTPAQDGEQSEFGKFIDIASQTLASHLCHTLRTQFMNINSIQSRQEKAVAGAIVMDSLPPALQMLATQFPSLAKIIKKNPELAAQVAQGLAGVGKPAQGPPDNGHQVDFFKDTHI